MKSKLKTFSNTELLTIRQLLRANNEACETSGDYTQMEDNQIIIDKITEAIRNRIADAA
jgi:hypothetical protein